jgi:NAD(P)H-hydrate repair Nnr-like enzyme with NAD(P)H-hydrate epimerase domain
MREDIIRMAQEAGIVVTGEAVWKLCELVAAAEREECVRICCEHWLNGGNAMECADAIRARGQAKDEMPLFDDWGKKW